MKQTSVAINNVIPMESSFYNKKLKHHFIFNVYSSHAHSNVLWYSYLLGKVYITMTIMRLIAVYTVANKTYETKM